MAKTEIKDKRLEPYFIKIVHSNYEVHKMHVSKKDGATYTKFVSTRTSLKSAIFAIANLKVSEKRKTKKTALLQEYLDDIRKVQSLLDSVLSEESIEKKVASMSEKILQLSNKVSELEKEILRLKPKEQDFDLDF